MVGKKILASICSLTLTIGMLSGCSESDSSNKIKIGLEQLIEHPALDSAREGFEERMKEKGYEDGKNIEYEYKNAQGDNAITQQDVYKRQTVESGKSRIITMKYYQLFRGKGTIGINNIKIGDYFGISNVYIDSFNNKKEITVLPVIFPIDINSDIVKRLSDSRRLESNEYYMNFSNIEMEPGYEFRQYVPGDNLNRVNWKRFSRNQELLVRKNDNIIAINKKSIIMNPYMIIDKYDEKRDRMMIENRILRTVLSLAFVLLDRNIEVEVYIYENDMWTIQEIRDIEDISMLQNKFVEYQFIHRFNEDDIKKSIEKLVVESDIISITANIDFFTESINSVFELSGVESEVVWVKNSNDQLNCDSSFIKRNLWVLMEDYQFYNLF